MNLKAPARVFVGETSTISPSSGFPIIWTSKPSKVNLFPCINDIPLEELTSQLLMDLINLALIFSCMILSGFPTTTSKVKFDLLNELALGFMEFVENMDFPWLPFKSIPEV